MVTLVDVGNTRFSDRKSLLVVHKCFVILGHQPAHTQAVFVFLERGAIGQTRNSVKVPIRRVSAWPTPKLAHVSSRSLISGTSGLGAASIHFLDLSTGLGRHQSYFPSALPPTVWDETAEPLADADGLSRLVRCLAKTLSAEIQYDDGDLIAKDTDIHSLLSNALRR